MTATDVGLRLRQARESRSISLQDVAKATHIKAHFLTALEEGNFESISSAAQLRGFLRAYGDFLGLDSGALLAMLTASADDDVPAAPAAPPDAEPGEPQQIFNEIAAILAARRGLLGLSLSDAAEHTRIPEHYLGYLETGAFDQFPSPVQARGMLGNYAAFLQADESLLLLRFAEALQLRLAGRQVGARATRPIAAPAPRPPSRLRALVSGELVAIVLVSAVLLGIFVFVIGRVLTVRAGLEAPATAPPLGSVLLPSATQPPTPTTPVEASPTPDVLFLPDATEGPTPTLPAGGNASLQVFLIIRQRTYLRVTVDGVVEFDGRPVPGANLPFGGDQSIEVLVGNAAGVQIFFNQQDLGTMGIFGEVVTLIFTESGPITPTPSITPTADPRTGTPAP